MESGIVVEYIDRQAIMCAVVLEVKKQRLRLLTETNREVNFSENRLSHGCKLSLNPSIGRDKLVEALKEIANRRKILMTRIDIKELWEVLNTEKEWIDLATMTEFCFPDNPTEDHESAVIRAFFNNRIYFKFSQNRFLANSEERVNQIAAQAKEAARRNKVIEEGAAWLKKALNDKDVSLSKNSLSENDLEFIDILKSFYLFEKESRHYALGKEMLTKAGINYVEFVLKLLVKLNVWDENENLDLYRYETPIFFNDNVIQHAAGLARLSEKTPIEKNRVDLTALPIVTIDGQSTLDFDDALSIEIKGDHYLLGVHIADVGHYIKKGDIIDREAVSRASSIYTPDQKISMLPPFLAEDLCSLKAGELRPAISTMIKLSRSAEIIDYDVFASLIRVKQKLTYYDVNMIADEDYETGILHYIAKNFRQKRLSLGAVQISLPEVNVWIDEKKELNVSRINRESAARMLVSEIMIMANWLTARFLAERDMPTIYRSQPGPRERLYKGEDGTIFHNWMQRKCLSRFVLSCQAEHHSGLGLDAYATATSPIRKYFDIVTQRQIRAVLGFEEPYSTAEIKRIIQVLEQPMSNVLRIQSRRNRYWLLKYLEKKIGQREKAIVLSKRKDSYMVLVTQYMIECELPLPGGVNLKPEDLIYVTIQYVNARKGAVSIFLC